MVTALCAASILFNLLMNAALEYPKYLEPLFDYVPDSSESVSCRIPCFLIANITI